MKPKWLASGAWVCENGPNAALKKDERHIMMTPMKHWDMIHVNLFAGFFFEPATVADNTSDLRFLWYKTMNDTGVLQYSERMTKGCLRTIPYPILKYVVVSEDLFVFTIVLWNKSNLMSIICQRSDAAAS